MTKASIWQLGPFVKDEQGQAVVLGAIALVVLMLVAGLGVDVGYLRYEKQQMQKAADAGAVAGATTLLYDSSDHAKLAAKSDTKANGFEDTKNGVTVAVNIPPSSGPFSGQSGFVEVIVTQPQPLFFMKLTGTNTAQVSSRAVASANGPSSGCIFAMDPTSAKSFEMNGTGYVSASCGIRVRSDNGDALDKNGLSGNIDTIPGGTGVVGGYSGDPSGYHPPPVTGIAKFADPLANLAAPTGYSTTCQAPPADGIHYTPGTYCNLSFTGNGTYYFAPGLYVLFGGMTAGGNTTLIGSDVTFYNSFLPGSATLSYQQININGTQYTTLSAPTVSSNGSIPGVLFFQDRNAVITSHNDTNTFNGTSGANYSGILYFPTTNLTYSGTPDHTASADIIAWQVQFNGDVKITDWGVNNPNSPLRGSFLIE